MPAVAIFGGLSNAEQHFSLNEEEQENIQPQPLFMENPIDYSNEEFVDEYDAQTVTEKVSTDYFSDIETFKPIILNDNQDLSTQKSISMDKDVVTFDPIFEDALLNKDSMPEIQDINATIELPPASSNDGGNDVHVHDIEDTTTPVPDLAELKESSSGAAKGNFIYGFIIFWLF